MIFLCEFLAVLKLFTICIVSFQISISIVLFHLILKSPSVFKVSQIQDLIDLLFLLIHSWWKAAMESASVLTENLWPPFKEDLGETRCESILSLRVPAETRQQRQLMQQQRQLMQQQRQLMQQQRQLMQQQRQLMQQQRQLMQRQKVQNWIKLTHVCKMKYWCTQCADCTLYYSCCRANTLMSQFSER